MVIVSGIAELIRPLNASRLIQLVLVFSAVPRWSDKHSKCEAGGLAVSQNALFKPRVRLGVSQPNPTNEVMR
jgi:hypothetical protein